LTADPAPSDPDHARVDFEANTVEVDGVMLPITEIRPIGSGVFITAGEGDKWVSLRLLKPKAEA